jgi:hypothetical protein
MSGRGLACWFLAVVTSPLALAQWAQHGVWVPGFQEPMPRYWTGTLNLAKGGAYSEGGWIEDAWLYLKAAGGSWELVREWHRGEAEPPITFGLSVAFDSTHFNDGDVVFVKFVVNDIVYNLYPTIKEETGFTVVHNKSFAYQHSDYLDHTPASDGASEAQYSLLALGYNGTKRSANGWSSATVEADSHDAAVLYFNTHGHPRVETDYLGGFIFEYEVEDWRVEINGTGYPPQNSTGEPITQFVLFDTCSTGYTNAYNTWFWPFYRVDFTGAPCINQALFGYAGTTLWTDRLHMAGLYWPMFEDWRTVVEMRDNLVEYCTYYWATFAEEFIRIERPYGTWGYVDEAADCPIWGDWYMRLKGVYTGDTTYPVGWYRNV